MTTFRGGQGLFTTERLRLRRRWRTGRWGMGAAPVGFEEFVAWRSPALLRTAWLLTGRESGNPVARGRRQSGSRASRMATSLAWLSASSSLASEPATRPQPA